MPCTDALYIPPFLLFAAGPTPFIPSHILLVSPNQPVPPLDARSSGAGCVLSLFHATYGVVPHRFCCSAGGRVKKFLH